MKRLTVTDRTLAVLASEKEKILSFREKVQIARRLDKLGFDAIELPAPKNEKEDSVLYRTIAASVETAQLKVPVRWKEEVPAVSAAFAGNGRFTLQVTLPVSTVRMEYMAHVKAAGMPERIADICRAAKETGAPVEFVAEDATRADEDFLIRACLAAVENGASGVTICDDAGDRMPEEFAGTVAAVREAMPDGVSVFVRTSDSLGLAVSCAVSAIRAGADGISLAMAGDGVMPAAAFAEVLRARGDALGAETGLHLTEIRRGIAALREEIVAESGASPFPAESAKVALGADSTRADTDAAILALGYELGEEDRGRVYEEIRRVAGKKGSIGERELDAIIAGSAMQVPSTYHLESYVSTSGNITPAMAQITLSRAGEKFCGVSTGDGPIDASFRAIEQIIGHHYELDEFRIQAVTEGREALGSAVVRLRSEGKLYAGNGISTDIIGASIRAYIGALNKIVYGGN